MLHSLEFSLIHSPVEMIVTVFRAEEDKRFRNPLLHFECDIAFDIAEQFRCIQNRIRGGLLDSKLLVRIPEYSGNCGAAVSRFSGNILDRNHFPVRFPFGVKSI